MIMWIENDKGEQFKIDTLDSSTERVDKVFDELQKMHGKYKFITENDFRVMKTMVIDVLDEEGNKMAELTCKKIKLK